VTTSLSSIAALVAVIYPAILNSHAPGTDTMQTWTCRWAHAERGGGVSAVTLSNDGSGNVGVPGNFAKLCVESVSPRFRLTSSQFHFVCEIICQSVLYG